MFVVDNTCQTGWRWTTSTLPAKRGSILMHWEIPAMQAFEGRDELGRAEDASTFTMPGEAVMLVAKIVSDYKAKPMVGAKQEMTYARLDYPRIADFGNVTDVERRFGILRNSVNRVKTRIERRIVALGRKMIAREGDVI